MKARLKITLDCNRNCPYCINKVEPYKDKWMSIKNLNEVNWSHFSSVIVSGGEPLLVPEEDLIRILQHLRLITCAHISPIYLQTNGDFLTKSLVKQIDNDIDGIGISIHNLNQFKHLRTRFEDISQIKPIQLYVQDIMFNESIDFFTTLYKKFSIRVWTEGQYDKNEIIYILK